MKRILEPGPVCRDTARRVDILAHPVLNGIDFVEYQRRVGPFPHILVVTFLKPLPDPPNSDPDGAYGLTDPTKLALVTIQGGARVTGIAPLQVTLVGSQLEVAVSEEGDFSVYTLGLGWKLQPDGNWQQTIPALDTQFSVAAINFKAGCPVDFDCRPAATCPPQPAPEPLIDYLAKDYASFRQLLIDLIPRLNPDWIERSPADLGIALLELLAYEGDQLSYFQDAVANEAYLDTVRQRVSARRHARLVDYRMHDGRNAWTFLHVAAGSLGTVPLATKILSRITAPLRNASAPPGTVIQETDIPAASFDFDPALVQVRVFETAFDLAVDPVNNEIFVHAWGNRECCLPRGVRAAWLYSLGAVAGGERVARLPSISVGDYLLLEEVISPATGARLDADPAHRQVVQIETVESSEDLAYRDRVKADGSLQVLRPGDTPLPLLHVTWRRADALAFPLCLSARLDSGEFVLNTSVARGNIVVADHGRTVAEQIFPPLPVPPGGIFRFRLGAAPLTMQCGPDSVQWDPVTGRMRTPRPDLTCDVRGARPAVGLLVSFPAGQQTWQVVPDLLDSSEFSHDFVAEVDAGGFATLRFGDNEYGQRPTGAIAFTAMYRLGNGAAGNVGAESLAHAVQPIAAATWPAIDAIRNPLAARDGIDPESIEQARQFAPAAFRAVQLRAVTEADYSVAALKMAEVAGVVATFRWTGSWYTVFVGVDPRDPEDLITLPGGRTRLSASLSRKVRNFLTRYRLAGYDLEIRSAEYVPLDIAIEICVKPDYFRGDVAHAVLQALSNHVNPDGSRGFFDPANFTFGQPVYLSRLYSAIQSVEGVQSAFIPRFQRYGKSANGELEAAVLPIGPWEIARLDNDSAFMENGRLTITAGGGK